MSVNKYNVLSSIGLGIVMAFVSTFSALVIYFGSQDPNLITKIVLWNITLSIYLIMAGWLPNCVECEMAVLLYIMFYAFIIGLLGYTLAFLLGISLIEKLRK